MDGPREAAADALYKSLPAASLRAVDLCHKINWLSVRIPRFPDADEKRAFCCTAKRFSKKHQ
jgi:hypothetical protein